jgi:hypothetical protein
LVGRIHDRDRLIERLSALAPEVVFIGLRAGETDEVGALVLKAVPAAKVLVITHDARYAYLHELRPTRSELFDFSPSNLSAAIIGAD